MLILLSTSLSAHATCNLYYEEAATPNIHEARYNQIAVARQVLASKGYTFVATREQADVPVFFIGANSDTASKCVFASVEFFNSQTSKLVIYSHRECGWFKNLGEAGQLAALQSAAEKVPACQ